MLYQPDGTKGKKGGWEAKALVLLRDTKHSDRDRRLGGESIHLSVVWKAQVKLVIYKSQKKSNPKEISISRIQKGQSLEKDKLVILDP